MHTVWPEIECLQIQPKQFPGDIQDTFFLNIPENFYVTSHAITPEIIVILFTRGLPYVQSTKIA